jgi:hypothetical protein
VLWDDESPRIPVLPSAVWRRSPEHLNQPPGRASDVVGRVNIHLRPPTEAAGIRLGSSRSDALDQCLAHGQPSEFRRHDESRASFAVKRPSGLSIFVYFDPNDLVEAVEFGRPPNGEDVVSYRGFDIFGTSADELIQRLSEHDRIDVTEDGRSATAPDLLLALWRPVLPEHPADEEGHYFESVLIARPGYYC